MHRPHPINQKIKGVSRLVILPDYQGIGLGSRFLQSIADIYKKEGWDFVIRTSAKNLVMKLYKDPKWVMYSCETMRRPNTGTIAKYSKALRTKCKTAGFRYKGI